MMFAEINIKNQFDQTQLESEHSKNNYCIKLANIKDSDQTAHVCSLINVTDVYSNSL